MLLPLMTALFVEQHSTHVSLSEGAVHLSMVRTRMPYIARWQLCSIVSQQAGALSGQLPGEMGSLGQASLTAKHLHAILSIVLPSLSATQLTTKVKNRVSWSTMDATLRRQLELCARLLACSQRQFLVDEEWKLLDDPTDFLTRIVREFAQGDKEVKRLPSDTAYPSCPSSILANSPWAVHVLAPILQNFPEVGATGSRDVAIDDTPRSQNVKSPLNASKMAISFSWLLPLARRHSRQEDAGHQLLTSTGSLGAPITLM
jgi:hypothetical protein